MAEPNQAEPQVVQKSPPTDAKQERTWAMLCHLGGLLGIIPPLVIWLVKKDESSLVNDNGKEAINFMITLAIGYIICIPLLFIIVGFFLMMALG